MSKEIKPSREAVNFWNKIKTECGKDARGNPANMVERGLVEIFKTFDYSLDLFDWYGRLWDNINY